jgi:hypothetical protein
VLTRCRKKRPEEKLLPNPHVLKNALLFSHKRLIRRVLRQTFGVSPGKSDPHHLA